VTIAGASSNSYVLQATDVGFTIRSVVTAHNTAGSGLASSGPTGVVTAAPTAPPPAPLNAAASNITNTSIQLGWSAAAGAASYDVSLGSSSSSTTATSFNFTQLSACTSYTMGVRARNSSGTSAWVYVTATTTGCTTPPPGGVT